MEYTKNIATTNERAAINRIRNIYRKESTTKDEILLSLGRKRSKWKRTLEV